MERFEVDRRLGSPSHWRYYFSYDAPSYALDDDLIGRIRRAALEGSQVAADMMRELIQRKHTSRRGYYFEVFLERLFDNRELFTSEERVGLAGALAEVMDEVPLHPGVNFGITSPWQRAEQLLVDRI